MDIAANSQTEEVPRNKKTKYAFFQSKRECLTIMYLKDWPNLFKTSSNCSVDRSLADDIVRTNVVTIKAIWILKTFKKIAPFKTMC